jgi:hypothetical protein
MYMLESSLALIYFAVRYPQNLFDLRGPSCSHCSIFKVRVRHSPERRFARITRILHFVKRFLQKGVFITLAR